MNVLNYLKDNINQMGLITDGRSVQQRHKLKALGIEDFFLK
jgi:putative hydrolase of the HAD superfamily